MSHKFLAGAGLLVLAGWGVSGLAVAGSDIKQVDLTLRILVDGPPPCSVKGSAVEFGNVVINRIDGTNYQQDAKYTLNCGNKVSDDLRMQLKGNTAVINGETVLSTDIAGLGVRIENAADNSLFAVGENNPCGGLFHNLTAIHNDNVIRHFVDHAEIVRNKDYRRAVFALQVVHQTQNLRLNRNVESRGRFVGDKNFRSASQSHCYHNALTHTAR